MQCWFPNCGFGFDVWFVYADAVGGVLHYFTNFGWGLIVWGFGCLFVWQLILIVALFAYCLFGFGDEAITWGCVVLCICVLTWFAIESLVWYWLVLLVDWFVGFRFGVICVLVGHLDLCGDAIFDVVVSFIWMLCDLLSTFGVNFALVFSCL